MIKISRQEEKVKSRMKIRIVSGMNIIAKPVNFLKEVKAELGKVAWSTREELMSSTMVVIVVTAILGVFIGVLDIILSRLLSILFK